MSPGDLAEIVLVTLRVAGSALLLVLVPAVALGRLLARHPFPGQSLVRAAVALPMVLPPVAVGLVLLQFLSTRHGTGRLLVAVFGPLLLTWKAAALASAVMAFPLLAFAAEQAFAGVPRRLEDVARTLGASRARVFLRVTLPLAAPGLAYGAAFAFARALGEFGATAIVAARIPGKTETIALAIFGRIEAFREGEALVLSALSIVMSFGMLAAAEAWLKRRRA